MLNFFMKQMLAKQLSALPKEQRDKVMKAFDDNPDFFKNMIEEISKRLKNGESQQSAMMAVISQNRSELERIMKG